MQHVSKLYEEIYFGQNFYVETSLVVGESGVLIDESGDRITFGTTPEPSTILVASSDASSGYRESVISSLRTTRRVFSNNKPEVGCCPSGEIYVEMHNPKGNIERMAMLVPYVRLVSYDDGRTSEWLRKGVFFTDTRDHSHNDDNLDIVTMHGYDAMMKAEVPYGSLYSEIEFSLTTTSTSADTQLGDWTKSDNTYIATYRDARVNGKTVRVVYTDDDSKAFGNYVTTSQVSGGLRFTATQSPPSNVFGKLILSDENTIAFPARDIDVVVDIANKIGVSLDARSDDTHKSVREYINKGYTIQYPAEYTMREVLSYIGAMYAGNWIINDDGCLQFIALYDLPKETSLLTNELGLWITFGTGTHKTRIKVIENVVS